MEREETETKSREAEADRSFSYCQEETETKKKRVASDYLCPKHECDGSRSADPNAQGREYKLSVRIRSSEETRENEASASQKRKVQLKTNSEKNAIKQ